MMTFLLTGFWWAGLLILTATPLAFLRPVFQSKGSVDPLGSSQPKLNPTLTELSDLKLKPEPLGWRPLKENGGPHFLKGATDRIKPMSQCCSVACPSLSLEGRRHEHL